MQATTKKQLIAAVVAALIIVVIAWVASSRQEYYQVGSLTGITYNPPGGATPYLTLSFSQPLDPIRVNGASAVIKSFKVAPDSPTPAAAAAPLLSLLIQGPTTAAGVPQGPTPFVPEYSDSAPGLVTTNTLPATIGGLTQPMKVAGTGSVWFAVPRRK
jgi:hypothetical protein